MSVLATASAWLTGLAQDLNPDGSEARQWLADELAKLSRNAKIYISHLKPGQIELIMGEIEDSVGDFKPRMLQNNQVFEF
mgnify:CR=1 FL=1